MGVKGALPAWPALRRRCEGMAMSTGGVGPQTPSFQHSKLLAEASTHLTLFAPAQHDASCGPRSYGASQGWCGKQAATLGLQDHCLRQLSTTPAVTPTVTAPQRYRRMVWRGGGDAVIAGRSISASQLALMPGSRPAATTATTRVALVARERITATVYCARSSISGPFSCGNSRHSSCSPCVKGSESAALSAALCCNFSGCFSTGAAMPAPRATPRNLARCQGLPSAAQDRISVICSGLSPKAIAAPHCPASVTAACRAAAAAMVAAGPASLAHSQPQAICAVGVVPSRKADTIDPNVGASVP
mmetsp:Transcript_6251/g.17949  ORF Transcript_6251/g.17949 Transcript_6251/m.17949 type:complete len:303 (+) Transcript_6251:2262-3170(+)